MKRLVDLTVLDLEASLVWRYEGGSGADAFVVSSERKSLSKLDDEIFLAATEFELFDSTRHFGFCFPADDSGIDYLQPVIVGPSRPVSFWFDGPVEPEVLASQWAALGKEPEDIFPVAFRCLVTVDGRTVSGTIPGVEVSQPLTPEPPAVGVPIDRGRKPRDAAAKSSRSMDRVLTARPAGTRRRDDEAGGMRITRRRKAEYTVEFTQGPFHGTGVTEDISPRGIFVRSSQIPGRGPMVKLTVNLPEGSKLVLKGRVVRSDESVSPRTTSPGFGLRLAEDVPGYEELLARLRKKPR